MRLCVDRMDERGEQAALQLEHLIGIGARDQPLLQPLGLELLSEQQRAQAQYARPDQRREADQAEQRQHRLGWGVEAERCAGAGGNRMRADGRHQRVECQQPADADRQIEIAVLQIFERRDEARIGRFAQHRLKCAQTGSEERSHHGLLLTAIAGSRQMPVTLGRA